MLLSIYPRDTRFILHISILYSTNTLKSLLKEKLFNLGMSLMRLLCPILSLNISHFLTRFKSGIVFLLNESLAYYFIYTGLF